MMTISSLIYRFITWLFDLLGLWNVRWLEDWYYDRFYGQTELDDEDQIDQAWLCSCGHLEESGLHCVHCGSEPPWGCDCSFCYERYREDYEDGWNYVPDYVYAYEDDFEDEPDMIVCRDCGAEIPNDGSCFYCETRPDGPEASG